MNLEQMIQRVESQLVEWFDTDHIDAITEMKDLLAQHEIDLQLARDRLDEITKRIATNTEAAALLPSQIESSVRREKTSQAMRQALELENLRRMLDGDREELPRLEQTIWSLEFRQRVLRRRLETMLQARKRR
jgi:hypothetical protein